MTYNGKQDGKRHDTRVVEALGDTLIGVLPWDPGTSRLLTHIEEAIARPFDAAQVAEDLDELRQLAAGDPEVLAYLEARAHGVSRAELLRRTGMSLEAYRRVRRRVRRWTDRLTGMVRRAKRGAQA